MRSSPDGSIYIAPSTGTLTTGTYEVPPDEDPCELPPTGGYRGLENQLYRVQIHDPGLAGTGATFKWSRENGSVAVRVQAVVSSTELTLESLGRDDVLGFKSGDLGRDPRRPRASFRRSGRDPPARRWARPPSGASPFMERCRPTAAARRGFPDSTSHSRAICAWGAGTRRERFSHLASNGDTAVHHDLSRGRDRRHPDTRRAERRCCSRTA